VCFDPAKKRTFCETKLVHIGPFSIGKE